MKDKENINNSLINLLNDPIINDIDQLHDQLKFVKDELDNDEYRIIIVGEFSSGKSTFLNALMGIDILPHGVEETTAAVTYIHNVAEGDEYFNKIRITFHDGRDDEILDIKGSHNALVDYVTAKSNRDVVKEISEVHVYLPFLNVKDKIVLIDTPGLNGIKEGLREITIREIQNAHANICLFHIKGVSDTDMELIKQFHNGGAPLFFVLNQIDRLIEGEETPDERIDTFSHDLKKILGTNDKLRVYGISALEALAARDHNIKRLYSDSEELTSQKRDELLSLSRISKFEKDLFEFVKNGDLEKNFLSQIESNIRSLLNFYKEDLTRELEILRSNLDNIPEKVVLENQKTKVEALIDKNKKIIKNKLAARMGDLNEQIRESIRKWCDEIHENASNIVDNWRDYEEAERAIKNNTVGNYVNNGILIAMNKLRSHLESDFDTIYHDMITVVNSFIPSLTLDKKEIRWDIKTTGLTYNNSDKLRQIEEDIKNKKRELDSAKGELEEAKRKQTSLNNDIRNKESQRYRSQQEHRQRIQSLGNRPQYKQTVHEKKRPWRLFGLINMPFKTTDRYYTDNQSQIEQWDKEKREIDTKYASIESRLNQELYSLKNRKNSVSTEVNESRVRNIEASIERLARQKQREQDEIELKRRNAKTQYLSELKRKTIDNIDKAVALGSGELYQSLYDNARTNINETETRMRHDLDKLYQDMLNRYFANIKMLISKIDGKADVKATEKRIKKLSSQVERIDNYIVNY